MPVAIGTWSRWSSEYFQSWEHVHTHDVLAGPQLLILIGAQEHNAGGGLAVPTVKLDGVALPPAVGTWHYAGASSGISQPNVTAFFVPSVSTGEHDISVQCIDDWTRGLILWVIEVAGVDAGDPIAGSASAVGWTSSPFVDMTSQQAGSLVIGWCAIRGAHTWPFTVNQPAGMTLQDDHKPSESNVVIHAGWATYANPSPATTRYQFTGAAAEYAMVAAFELRAAALPAAAKRRPLFLSF